MPCCEGRLQTCQEKGCIVKRLERIREPDECDCDGLQHRLDCPQHEVCF